jgi:hypothetical protein
LLGSSVRDANSSFARHLAAACRVGDQGPAALVTDLDQRRPSRPLRRKLFDFLAPHSIYVAQNDGLYSATRKKPQGLLGGRLLASINLDLEAGLCSPGPGFSLVSPGEGNPARTRFPPPRVFPLATRHPSVQRVRPRPAIPSFAPWKHQSRSEDLPRHHER